MTLTLTDMFCGAGGSSTGAIQVPGIEVRTAMNHWDLAVETHNSNHPDADHVQADISQTELWQETLPDEAAERSRATMWDVLRFAEHHRYQAIIVENVVEVVDWIFYPAWRAGLDAAGYHVQPVSLNSMHAQLYGDPAPQSRDRVYFVCSLKGNPMPDVRPRPVAWCVECDEVVHARQTFKRPDRVVGRYRSQYVYRCPNQTCRNSIVEPAWMPAASIIDWTLTGERIGDRKRPLAEKTRSRIAAGIARYWSPIHLEAAGNTDDASSDRHPRFGDPNSHYRAWRVEPLRSVHATESKALAVPVEGRADVNRARPLEDPLRTQNTRLETGIAQAPFIAELRGGGSTARSASDPLSTVTAGGNHHGLVMSYYGNNDGTKSTAEALDTVTTTDRHALLTPAGGTWNDTAYSPSSPARTMTTRETTALVMRNNGGGAEMTTPASEPVRTITTAGHQSILTPGDLEAARAQVDDVYFRMLEPSECKKAMAFPHGYRMLGNRRAQVKLAGNAVTPPAARDLIARVAKSLGVTA